MIGFERLNVNDRDKLDIIVGWCDGRDADFLRQWAGRGYEFPLTSDKISARLEEHAEIYTALRDGKTVGTIEIISRDGKSALVGRYIISPSEAGQGLGTEIMNEFKRFCKEKQGLERLTLCVFDFNVQAHRCYIKAGFTDIGFSERPGGAKAIDMECIL